MKIKFFETNNGLDIRAIYGGVYHVELLNEKKGESLSLYIGESVWVIERCGVHLYVFYKNPDYFGLTEEHLKDDNLTLKFSLLEEQKSPLENLKVKTKIIDKKQLKKQRREIEKKYIVKNKPLTQRPKSDRQIVERVKKVESAMRENGW